MDDRLKIILSEIARYSPGMIYQFQMFPDGTSRFPFVSAGIDSVYGLKPMDVIDDASMVLDLVHPEDLPRVLASIEESKTTLKDWVCEYRVILPGRDIQWVYGNANPRRLNDGSVLWNGFLSNITSRKKVEEELHRTNRLFQLTAQINQMVLYLKDKQEVFVEACRIAVTEGGFQLAWVGVVNRSEDRVVPVAWKGSETSYLSKVGKISISPDSTRSYGPTGTAARDKKTIVLNDIQNAPKSYDLWRDKALDHGLKSSIALPIIVKDEVIATYNLYSSAQKFFNESEIKFLEKIVSNISFAIGAIENDLDHRRSEEALRLSEKKFRLIFQEAPLGVAIINSITGKFYNINPQYLKILGRTEDEMRELDWMFVTHPDDVKEDLSNMALMNAGKIPGFKMSKRYIRKDGELIWIDMSVVPLDVMSDETPRHLCMVEDVTNRKIAEDRLKRSEEMFSAIANLSPDMISVVNGGGEILFNSLASRRLLGYEMNDIVGKKILDFIHPDDKSNTLSRFKELYDGTVSHISVEYRILNKDGKYTWVELTAHNQLKNPHINGVIVITREIGGRKKLEQDLKKALDIRDEFISIASHELKTPLTSLKLQLQMLGKTLHTSHSFSDQDQKICKSLVTCDNQVNRISQLVENLLDVTRIESGNLNLKFETYDLSENLNEILEGFSSSFHKSGMSLETHIQKNIKVTLDKCRIEQVFSNLISNAVKYAPGAPLFISLKEEGSKVHLVVSDRGHGIEIDKQPFIFERFERVSSLKNVDGLGLGLYISKQILLAHGGDISVESRIGEGTTFTVILPLKSP